MRDDEKYRSLRITLIVLFVAIFMIGVVSRGSSVQKLAGREKTHNPAKKQGKLMSVPIITDGFRNAAERRVIMDDIRANPEDDELHVKMGVELAKSGLTSEAILYFNQALEINPRNASALHNMGLIYEFLGEYEDSKKYLNKAEDLDPKNLLTKSSLKRVEFVLEYQPEGEKKYQAELNKALLYMGKDNTNLERAKTILERLIREDPLNMEALNAIGVVSARMGDIDKARDIFSSVIAVDPGYLFSYINLATIAEARGDFSESRIYLERALNLADNVKAKNEIEKRINSIQVKEASSRIE